MKKYLQFSIFFCCSLTFCSVVNAQLCPPPPTADFSYCYDSNESDVVIFEICDAAIVDAIICQGDWESGFDDLTIYEGAMGSGTTGTIVAGPLDGDLTGTAVSTTTAGNCLIFVSNSDGSVSCASGSRPTLEVFLGTACPVLTYDASYCYGSGETDVIAFELCCAADEVVSAEICSGDYESGFDDLTIYEGPAGSGTGGTIVAGPLDGDLVGTIATSMTAGNCLIFVSNTDGSVSCVSGSRPELLVNFECLVTTLAVDLVEFNAKAMDNYNLISWETAKEVNNNYHLLEKSRDGKSNWTTVDKIDGKNLDSNMSYSVKDLSPEVMSYYRLTSVDINGMRTYSKIEIVDRRNFARSTRMQVNPNPFNDFLEVVLESKLDQSIKIQILSLDGKILQSTVTEISGNTEERRTLNTSDLQTGVYLVRIEMGSHVETQRIVKFNK